MAALSIHIDWAPLIWAAAVAATMLLDWIVMQRLVKSAQAASNLRFGALIGWMSATFAVYSSIGVYFWTYGGEYGRCFALIQACAGMMQAAMQMRASRPLVAAAVVGHGWILLCIPALIGLNGVGAAPVLIGIGGLGLFCWQLFNLVNRSAAESASLQQASREAEIERAFTDSIIDNVPNLLTVVDAETGRIILVNKAAQVIGGTRREDVIGRGYEDLYPADQAAHLRVLDAEAVAADRTPPFRDEKITLENGNVRTLRGRRVCVRDDQGRPRYVIVTAEDVTDMREAEAQVVRLAHYDSLTELPNRVLFRTRLNDAFNDALRHSRPAALHWIDLDYFKEVNDTLGHMVGDQLLIGVAERLSSAIGPNDTVARLGGDEFGIVQRNVASRDDAATLAGRIVDSLSQPFHLSGREVRIGASVGIAFAPIDAKTVDELMVNADMALYRCKQAGRGGHSFFEREMTDRRRARRTMEQELRAAFANGEFSVMYQPQLHLKEGRIAGCEALVRWKSKGRFISPAEFIPVAEEIGLINQLGEWVLKEACAEAAKWPAHMKVAVNISPAQFKDQNLVRNVISAVAHAGLSPDRLEVEITESTLLQGSQTNLTTLFRLRELGLSVALDDFGTGFSSLNYLRQFPFTKIKIDRSFVSDLSLSLEAVSIVKAITGMAASLGMDTTAEGVETERQMEMVTGYGCTEVQGYLVSRPCTPADLKAVFDRYGGFDDSAFAPVSSGDAELWLATG